MQVTPTAPAPSDAPVTPASDPAAPAAQVPEGEGATPPPAPEATEPPAEPAKKPERDPAASRFSALSKKEKELRQAQKAFEAQRAEFENARKSWEAERNKAPAKPRNPLDALKAAGYSYQDATQALLGNWEAPPEDPVEAKIRPALEKASEVESYVKRLEESLTTLQTQLAEERRQQSLGQVMAGIRQAAQDPAFELVQAMGDEGVDLVRDIMTEYWNENERMLDYKEAVQIAEEYYEKELLTRFEKTGKMKARLAASAPKADPAPKTPAKAPSKEAAPAPTAPATLTNDLVTGSGDNVNLDDLDPEAAKEMLARKLRFKPSPRK